LRKQRCVARVFPPGKVENEAQVGEAQQSQRRHGRSQLPGMAKTDTNRVKKGCMGQQLRSQRPGRHE
jgi:hypothetical protein